MLIKKEMELRFIDSIKFMSSSLDSPVNNLDRGDHEFWAFEDYNYSQCKLLIRKGNTNIWIVEINSKKQVYLA